MTVEELAIKILRECQATTGRHCLPLRKSVNGDTNPAIEARWLACDLLVKQGHAKWIVKGTTPYWPGIELIDVGRSKT